MKKILGILFIIVITYIFSYRITMHLIIPEINGEHQISLTVYGITDNYYTE